MLIEDLHWIDSSSEELLAKFTDITEPIPLLIVHTRRPEYRLRWLDRPNLRSLPLEPLKDVDISRIVQARVGQNALPVELSELITKKAEGNALFAEEMAALLLDRGITQLGSSGVRFDNAAVAGAMPGSVQALLGSRVDELAPRQRALLQAAAAIGRRFDPNLLAAVAAEPESIDQGLEEARASGFLHVEHRTGELVFKHALLRDALYGSMLSGQRSTLHLKIAEEIERRGGNRLSEVAQVLAYHYAQTSRADKAFLYSAMAAKKSLSMYSLAEAEGYCNAALTILEEDQTCASDEAFADLLADHALTLQLAYKIPALVGGVEAWLYKVHKLGNHRLAVTILHHYANALVLAGRYRDAREIAVKLGAMAEALDDDTCKVYAFTVLIWTEAILAPRPAEQLSHEAEWALEAASRANDLYVRVWLRWVLGVDAFHRGFMQRTYAYAQELTDIGERSNDPRARGLGLWLMGWSALVNDDYATALRFGSEGIRAAVTPWDLSTATNLTATALILLRRVDEGLPMLEERRRKDFEAGRRYAFVANDAVWGVAFVLKGRLAKGIRFIKGRIAAREREGYRGAADWYRITLCFILLDILEAKRKPRFSVLIRNLPYIVLVRLTAPKQIDRMMEKFRANPLFHPDGFHYAKLNLILGLRWKVRGNKVLAEKHLSAAKRIAMSFGQTPLLEKIKKSLSDI